MWKRSPRTDRRSGRAERKVITDADLSTVTDPAILKKHPGLQRKSGRVGFLGHGSPSSSAIFRSSDFTIRDRISLVLRRDLFQVAAAGAIASLAPAPDVLSLEVASADRALRLLVPKRSRIEEDVV